ncbi:MAG: hypothetical protein IT492_04960 [Gammaproteobacteria bacterium]|nr:hypothetical protein [Gammaproteobacteria bacterium]
MPSCSRAALTRSAGMHSGGIGVAQIVAGAEFERAGAGERTELLAAAVDQ